MFWFLGEAEFVGRDGEEEAFDGIEGAVGEDVDGVDDVVEEGLAVAIRMLIDWVRNWEKHTTGG